MYSKKQMEPFLNKVKAEAEKAADDVYRKYQEEFEQRVRNQIPPDSKVHFSMGSAYLQRGEIIPENQPDDFLTELAMATFYIDIRTGFNAEIVTKE